MKPLTKESVDEGLEVYEHSQQTELCDDALKAWLWTQRHGLLYAAALSVQGNDASYERGVRDGFTRLLTAATLHSKALMSAAEAAVARGDRQLAAECVVRSKGLVAFSKYCLDGLKADLEKMKAEAAAKEGTA